MEHRWQRPSLVEGLRPRHHCASQCAGNKHRSRHGRSSVLIHGKNMQTGSNFLHRSHHSQTHKSAVSQHQWSADRGSKRDFDMPQTPIESGQLERLCHLAARVEWLSLNPDCRHGFRKTGMAQRVEQSAGRSMSPYEPSISQRKDLSLRVQ
jgi:hypothetical protein